MERTDIRKMADYVAEAIFHSAAGPDADFSEVDADERQQFVTIAHAAINAHHDFLTSSGFKVQPAGAVAIPTCKEEALAMVMAVRKFREGEKVIKPRLILPPQSLATH